MKVLFVIKDREIELLDRDIMFEEGEQVLVDSVPMKVHSVIKSISVIEKNAECVHRVNLA